MNGYSSHTFMWYNKKKEYFWINYQIETDQGIRHLNRQEATRLKGEDPDHATRDLFEAIAKGDYPSWTVYVQIMTPEQAKEYRFDPFDITKVWFHDDSVFCKRVRSFSNQKIGRITAQSSNSVVIKSFSSAYWRC